MIKRVIFFILLCLVAGGCVTAKYEQSLAENKTPKYFSEYNFSSGENAAVLKLEARPPSQQFLIYYYQINIDNYQPLIVFKHSDSDIKLDPGNHIIQITAVKGKDEAKAVNNYFGKPAEIKIDLSNNEWKTIEYVGPYWMWDKGKLSVK